METAVGVSHLTECSTSFAMTRAMSRFMRRVMQHTGSDNRNTRGISYVMPWDVP